MDSITFSPENKRSGVVFPYHRKDELENKDLAMKYVKDVLPGS